MERNDLKQFDIIFLESMGIYIDYYISSTPHLNYTSHRTKLDECLGEQILKEAIHQKEISSSKIKELVGIDIEPNMYIIQCLWSTYDSNDDLVVIKVID